MPLDPYPFYLMQWQQGVQFLPQVNIFDGGFFVGGFPAVIFPVWQPLINAVHHIAAVGVKGDIAGFLKRFKRRYNGLQFHTVVGCVGFSAREFFFDIAAAQNNAPAAGAGVAGASSVRIKSNLFH